MRRNALRQPRLEILAPEDVQKIIEAAYDLLENFGVKVYNQEALEIFADGGGKVDFNKRVSFMPQEMVDKALQSVPSSISIYNHEGQNPAVLEKDRVNFCAGSVALNILDSSQNVCHFFSISPNLYCPFFEHIYSYFSFSNIQKRSLAPQ